MALFDERVRELFLELISLESASRQKVLAGIRSEALRKEAVALLRADARAHLVFGGDGGDLLTGSRVGPYEILGIVGRGGMAVVYRASHRKTSRGVALKMLRTKKVAFLEGIRREIRALRRLRHQGVVRVVEDGIHEGMPWFAMELLDGNSLRRFIEHGDQIVSRRELLKRLGIVRKICRPLAYLHQEGIIHRDLKPENILLQGHGKLALIDLGISTSFAGEATREEMAPIGEGTGTLAYMAPEQARGGLVDARADLFALGVILFELLTGHRPFRAASGAELRAQQETGAKLPAALVSAFPGLGDIVSRLLAFHPAERMGNADDLDDALAALGARGWPGRRPRRRHRILYRSRLVGRDEELAIVRRNLEQAREGRSRLLLVSGENGSGKTRFAVEASSAARRLGFSVVLVACGPGRSEDVPLGFRSILRALCDRCREVGREGARELLGPQAPILADLEPELSYFTAGDKPAPLPPVEARSRILHALRSATAALARHAPCFIVLDDLAQADDLTRQLFRSLGLLPLPAPVCMLATQRPQAPGEPAPAESIAAMHLPPLAPHDITRIANDMMPGRPLPHQFLEVLRDRSEGNPFFAAEYLRLFASPTRAKSGLTLTARAPTLPISRTNGVAAEAGNGRFPEGIRALAEARLRELDEPCRKLVLVAAVIGRTFTPLSLATVTGVAQGELTGQLDKLCRCGILEPAAQRGYRFVHGTFRDLIYEQLPRSERRRWHRRAGKLMQGAPESLARHCEAAGLKRRTAALYLEAADEALARCAYEDAARFFGKAAQHGPARRSDRLRAICSHSELQRHLGDFEAAIRHAQMAMGIARTRIERRDVFRLLTLAIRGQGRPGDALDPASNAYLLSRQIGDQREIGRDAGAVGAILQELGQRERAEELERQALQAARSTGDLKAVGTWLGNLATIEARRGNLAKARSLYEEACTSAIKASDRFGEARARSNIALLLIRMGKVDEARHSLATAIAIARETGNRPYEAHALVSLADLDARTGKGSEVKYGRALDIVRELGDKRTEALIRANLGTLQIGIGKVTAARRTLKLALALAEETGRERVAAHASANLALAAFALGHLDESVTTYQDALSVARRLGLPRLEASIHAGLAAAYRYRGYLAASARHLKLGERLFFGREELEVKVLLACEAGHLDLASGGDGAACLAKVRTIATGGRDLRSVTRPADRLARAVEAKRVGRRLLAGALPEDAPEHIESS